MSEKINQDELKKIKTRASKAFTDAGGRNTMLDGIAEMYWMDSKETVNDRDQKDVKLTISPSARNDVTGMVRLLKTSDPHWTATSKKSSDNANKIEAALEQIVKESSKIQRAKIAADASFSTVLYAY